jgi:3-oxocholest-4-en-26-oyl-CoA dehydrogenase alpha subunit
MDFELNQEQKRFKEEVCKFLDKEVTKGVVEESEAGLGFGPHSWQLMRKLGERRWLAPSFPKEYGGLGLSFMYHYIVAEELDYRNALVLFRGLGLVGVAMAGPVILRYGSEEIKEEFLPRLARGEIELVLGYTEPDAGSDLSRISIRAVEDGNDFVITGQKTFNTACHYAQYHWLAARTDPDAPPHKGISIFLVDLKTPGISFNPLWEMAGARTNEVFYDEVRVPKKYLVGEKNKGWYYLTSALDLERLITVSGLQRTFDDLVAYTKSTIRNGKPMEKDPLVQERLADLAIELSVARNLTLRVAWLLDKGLIPNVESAVAKMFSAELHQRLANTVLEMIGLYGVLQKGSKYAVMEGTMERFFRASFIATIGGGSVEIMRNIIARRGLGFPK